MVLDGPVGSELLRRGVPTPLPRWSADAIEAAPEVLASIHRDYAAAGATVHTANTFRTRARNVGPRWRELATAAVQIGRAALPAAHRLAGSIAPLSDCYRPDLSPGAGGRAEHQALARALAEAGVDLLLCETFPHVEEALTALEVSLETGLPVWVAFTAGPDADLMTPEALAQAARRAEQAGASAVLVNCVPASRTLPFVCALADAAPGVPFGAYANAGHVDERMGWRHADEPGADEAYAALARSWQACGATIIGGCCGTGPAHVRALAAQDGRRG